MQNINETENVHLNILFTFLFKTYYFHIQLRYPYIIPIKTFAFSHIYKCLKRNNLTVKYKHLITAVRQNVTIAAFTTNLFHMAFIQLILLGHFSYRLEFQRTIIQQDRILQLGLEKVQAHTQFCRRRNVQFILNNVYFISLVLIYIYIYIQRFMDILLWSFWFCYMTF